MTEDLPTRGTAHHENYLRYKAKQDAAPRVFTASQQVTPLQYLPYAHYPETPEAEPEPEQEQPTWEKPCERCNRTVTRWRGMADVSCQCGAEYNSGGQRLRDDWRSNPSTWDEDVSDLDGYEIQHAGDS